MYPEQRSIRGWLGAWCLLLCFIVVMGQRWQAQRTTNVRDTVPLVMGTGFKGAPTCTGHGVLVHKAWSEVGQTSSNGSCNRPPCDTKGRETTRPIVPRARDPPVDRLAP